MPGVYEVLVTLGEVNWVIKIDFRHGKISIADKSQTVEVEVSTSTPDTGNNFACLERPDSKFCVIEEEIHSSSLTFWYRHEETSSF